MIWFHTITHYFFLPQKGLHDVGKAQATKAKPLHPGNGAPPGQRPHHQLAGAVLDGEEADSDHLSIGEVLEIGRQMGQWRCTLETSEKCFENSFLHCSTNGRILQGPQAVRLDRVLPDDGLIDPRHLSESNN